MNNQSYLDFVDFHFLFGICLNDGQVKSQSPDLKICLILKIEYTGIF